jgi:hypothetical protein
MRARGEPSAARAGLTQTCRASSQIHTQEVTNMARIAVILLADTDRPEGMGRMANALTTAQEAKEAGDDVRLILDGAGTKWAGELASEEHKYHRLFAAVRDQAGACVYCARAYGVKDQVEAAGVGLLDEYKGHPSVRQLIVDGYGVVTF